MSPLSAEALRAYFRRIGVDGVTTPDEAALRRLIPAHIGAIPFENLDVLLGRPIDLEPERVFEKLVLRGRGGYCFEQNTLFLRVLRTLGYDASPISARVRLQRPRELTPPRTHVFLCVQLDGAPWLVDVGVGGLSPTAPLRWVPEVVQPTPHEARRLIQEDGRWFHQALLGDVWSDVCEFTGEAMPPIDWEVGNWYTSTHPGSHFKARLMVARALDGGRRVTLLNRELTVRSPDGSAETEALTDPQSLLRALSTHFALDFPPETRFECPALDWPAGGAA